MRARETTAKGSVVSEREGPGKALSDAELDQVSGGGMLNSAISNVIKSIGDGLSQAARKS